MNKKLRILDTQSKNQIKIEDPTITVYSCGPTVYDYAHIGNFRTFISVDLLKRSLLYLGYDVKHVMNLTDVDDKTIARAISEKKSLTDLTAFYTQSFIDDCEKLKIMPPEKRPRATEYIDQMIEMIKQLIDKGAAYEKNGSVYFSIQAFPTYGELSHLDLDNLQKGASGVVDTEDKEEYGDFVLWKAYDQKRDQDIFWTSPWGKGRPGWHLECSCMAMDCFGDTVDIHCGGVDLKFPHHENERAQSETVSGKKFAKVWMHTEHLLVEGKKMSKSLGNFYTLRDLLEKGYHSSVIRYMLLKTHYRHALNFTTKEMEASQHALARVKDWIEHVSRASGNGMGVSTVLQEADDKFKEALCDDLNISVALSHIFSFMKEIDIESISEEESQQIINQFHQWNQVIECFPLEKETVQITPIIEEWLAKREDARQKKEWKVADHYRDLVLSKGYEIKDTPKGAVLTKKENV